MEIKNHTAYVVYYHADDAPADPFKLKLKFVPQEADGDLTTVKSDSSGEGNKDADTDGGDSNNNVEGVSVANNNIYNYNEKINILVILEIMNILILK